MPEQGLSPLRHVVGFNPTTEIGIKIKIAYNLKKYEFKRKIYKVFAMVREIYRD
jgi:hypothetical protein